MDFRFYMWVDLKKKLLQTLCCRDVIFKLKKEHDENLYNKKY